MSHIFLSYSRKDGAYVDALAAQLEQAGFRTWVDRKGIAGGEQWRREIVDAVRKASLFLLFLSPHSARSQNVRKEVDLADQARVRILPVAIAPVDIPDDMQYQLAGVQVIEMWRDHDRGADALFKTLQRHGLQPDDNRAARSGSKPAPRRDPGVDLSDLGGSKVLDALRIGRLFGRKR
jgi:TIR domain